MQENKLQKHLHLHFIVFIWGFTAVLGKLIHISAIPLVWYRLLIAVITMGIVVIISKQKTKITVKSMLHFSIGGVIIGLHWLTFFYAIKISNISITLTTLATGAFFASILEPLFLKKRIKAYELIFAGITVLGIVYIYNVEIKYSLGILFALISAFLSALFSVINSEYIKKYDAKSLTFYELIFALITISFFVIGNTSVNLSKITSNKMDIFYLIVLGTICTAYAMTASTKLLRSISPFTMMLTINLEPIYGIALAILIFKDTEKMSTHFYIGAIIIIITVVLNGFLKLKEKKTI